MRSLYESEAKEKWAKILLLEAKNEANNGVLASFSTKNSEILVIFTRHLTRAKVSLYLKAVENRNRQLNLEDFINQAYDSVYVLFFFKGLNDYKTHTNKSNN